jgi:hypothetical protein
MDLTWADGENCRTTCGGLDMANLETEFRTLVSVQDARAADAVEGHLAWGRLVDSDYVLVHGPPDWLGRDVDPEVLIARVASGRTDEVERIRIARIQLHGVLHDPASEMTGIRLDHPSGCPAQGPPDGAGSERRLATGAELCSAVDTVLGPAPAEEAPDCTEEALRPVVAWEEIRRHSIVEDCRLPAPPVERMWICTVFGRSVCS